MNSASLRALFFDALYQVLDNWVFRILTLLAGLVVLMTIVFGFREEGVVFLFGLRTWSYAQFFGAIGSMAPPGDVQGAVLEGYLSIVFDHLAGKLGVIFCIAASAFFVPQMMEKGAADVIFHKPVSRLTLYLSRYAAGLLFVGILSGLMALGMYLGILFVSGRNDPGILLAAPLLTYLFGLIYPVSMAIGVYTRSTVASILITTIFFLFNGCVHFSWNRFEAADADKARVSEQASSTAAAEESAEEEKDSYLSMLQTVVAGLHFVLPKTSDAAVMAADLRRTTLRPVFRDDHTGMAVYRLPSGWSAMDSPSLPGLPSSSELSALLGEPGFGLVRNEEPGGQRVTLLLRAAEVQEVERRGQPARDVESARDASRSLAKLLEELPGTTGVSTGLMSFGNSASGSAASARSVTWWQSDPGARAFRSPRVAVVLQIGEWIQTVWFESSGAQGDPAGEESDLEQVTDLMIEPIDRIMGLDPPAVDDAPSRERHLGFSSPWKSNVIFSVGSSLTFAGLMLFLGWLRLRRIEF